MIFKIKNPQQAMVVGGDEDVVYVDDSHCIPFSWGDYCIFLGISRGLFPETSLYISPDDADKIADELKQCAERIRAATRRHVEEDR